MARKRKNPQTEEEESTSVLPSDVVECILVRLPVKSLLRLKSVCKVWNGIISSSHFTKMQFEASSYSSSRFLVRERPLGSYGYGNFRLLRFEDQSFRRDADLEFPFDRAVILCSCNGIILLQETPRSRNCVLWNPCTRMHVKIWWPGSDWPVAYGLCHDPTTDDYKVVIVTNRSTYSIFSCKKKAWTKRNQDFSNHKCIWPGGVCVDGGFYWICDEYRASHYNREILFFDGIRDKFDILKLPTPLREDYRYNGFLVNVRGRLGLIFNCQDDTLNQTMIQIYYIMEGTGEMNSFKKIIAVDRSTNACGRHIYPCCIRFVCSCSINENMVMILVDCSRFVIYDAGEEKVIHGIQDCPETWASNLVRCRDSLFFPIQNIRIQPARKCRKSTTLA